MAVLACCAVVMVASAQPQSQKKEPKQGPITLGETVLSGFETASYIPSVKAVATGPSTRMDSTDRERKTVTHLFASSMQAFIVPKSRKNEVERVEAEGNVRFEGERTLPDGSLQTIRVQGTKGVYHRVNQTLRIESGITYELSQPSADRKTRITVIGTAGFATYDLELQVLKLQGGFELKYTAPDILDGPAEITGKGLTADLGRNPPVFKVENTDDLTGKTQFKPKPAPDKPKPKEKPQDGGQGSGR
jgi:hypothetical protein